MARARSLNRQILGLALPSILANITVPLVGIVDLAIAGHLGDAAAIGGIAIGTMLFDMLYWNVGFLRVGTGGITAQAFGRRDWKCASETFVQGIATAWLLAIICLIIQWVYVDLSFLVLDCTPEVEKVAREYFFIRIWAVPATMSLFVFKGWFIGMQNTVFSMITDIWVNVVNMVASWLLAFHTPLGLKGVAVGTLVAQWSGLLVASLLLLLRYRSTMVFADIRHAVRWRHIRSFFRINLDLLVRSFSMLVVYNGFTIIASYYGDVQLAVAAVMMKLLLLYSYFVDGFAYAGEALTGRFIGEQDAPQLHRVVRLLFWWGFGIAVVSTLAYAIVPETLIGLITDNPAVLSGCRPFLFWLLLMPVFSCIAFIWDGIYIGATASAALRNGTVGSAIAFLAAYFLLAPVAGIQALYIAYFVHLIWRSAYQTLFARKHVYSRVLAILLLLLALPTVAHAQDVVENYRRTAGNAAILYRGRKAMDYRFPFNGTYFWESSAYQPGHVCYNGKIYRCDALNIDAAQQEVLLKDVSGVISIMLNRDFVSWFEMGGRKFVNARVYFDNPSLPEGLFELLYDGRVQVLCQVKKELIRSAHPEMADTGADTPLRRNVMEVFQRKVTCYYVDETGEAFKVTRRKDIYKRYKTHRKVIERAIDAAEPANRMFTLWEFAQRAVEIGERLR